LNSTCFHMPTLIITRTPAFKIGMESIQLLVDGKKMGTLWNSKPCTVTVQPGRHTILPKKNGVRGDTFEVTVAEGEIRHLTLNDVVWTRNVSGLGVLGVLIINIPNDLLGGMLMFWIKMAFLSLEFAVVLYLIRGYYQQKLTISEGPVERVVTNANAAGAAAV